MKAVLLVDDDPSVLGMVSGALGANARVLRAGSGREGLQLLAARDDIGLVLSKSDMPTMDGVEMHAEMLKQDKLRLMPFVLMTDRHCPSAHDDVFVLRKPFKPTVLRVLVAIHLGLA